MAENRGDEPGARFEAALADETRARLAELRVSLDAVARAVDGIERCFRSGGKLLVFGNGGSAADAQHLAAELVGRFAFDRPALPAVALTTDTSALTAIANDFGFERVFARQIEALGRIGDVALAISTSGTSANVLAGIDAAHRRGVRSLAITGRADSPLARRVDVAIVAGDGPAARVQEAHLVVEHALCEAVETLFFGGGRSSTPAVRHRRAAPRKLVSLEELLALRERWREAGATVVWTNGCFDLLHVGHVSGLQAARTLGDVLVVGVNGDDAVRELKGSGRPLVPVAERAALLAALEAVDFVVEFDELTPVDVLSQLRPDVHCKGADYASDAEMPEADVVRDYGGRVELVPLVPSRSTTELVRRAASATAANDRQPVEDGDRASR